MVQLVPVFSILYPQLFIIIAITHNYAFNNNTFYGYNGGTGPPDQLDRNTVPGRIVGVENSPIKIMGLAP